MLKVVHIVIFRYNRFGKTCYCSIPSLQRQAPLSPSFVEYCLRKDESQHLQLAYRFYSKCYLLEISVRFGCGQNKIYCFLPIPFYPHAIQGFIDFIYHHLVTLDDIINLVKTEFLAIIIQCTLTTPNLLTGIACARRVYDSHERLHFPESTWKVCPSAQCGGYIITYYHDVVHSDLFSRI